MIYDDLHAEAAALGTRLFTISLCDFAAGLARRAHTSHPLEYPVSGTKPMERDSWYRQVIDRGETFVANTPAEFAKVFFDHALITSLGLGAAVNIPVRGPDGAVVGTVNLLAEEGHFTPERLTAYHALVARHHAALAGAMTSA
jgi:hypothetical protein